MQTFICVDDYEKAALEKLPREALDYYRSGSDNEVTLRANREAFTDLRILPRFLRDVSKIELETEIFGDKISCPIGVSPSAMHKLAHSEGELATAKGTDQVGTVMALSTLSTTSIEDIAKHRPRLIRWFQLYLFTDRDASVRLVKRAESAGFKALVFTVDAPKLAVRRRDIRNNFKIPAGFLANFDHNSSQALQNLDYIDASIKWSDLSWLASITTMPILVKGLLTAEDCVLALDHGAKGIIVSNHGGRQLDGAPATVSSYQNSIDSQRNLPKDDANLTNVYLPQDRSSRPNSQGYQWSMSSYSGRWCQNRLRYIQMSCTWCPNGFCW